MIRSLLMGLVAGMRSMTPVAVISGAAQRGPTSDRIHLPGLLFSPRVSKVAFALATAELLGDKMRWAPDRITTPGILARIATGAMAGMVVAPPREGATPRRGAGRHGGRCGRLRQLRDTTACDSQQRSDLNGPHRRRPRRRRCSSACIQRATQPPRVTRDAGVGSMINARNCDTPLHWRTPIASDLVRWISIRKVMGSTGGNGYRSRLRVVPQPTGRVVIFDGAAFAIEYVEGCALSSEVPLRNHSVHSACWSTLGDSARSASADQVRSGSPGRS